MSDVMTCAYCGKRYSWKVSERRRFWPSSLYAICWPCSIPAERHESWLWRRLARLVSIDWSTTFTRGRQVYASVLDGRGGMRGVNYTTGMLIGWDRWSDEHPSFTVSTSALWWSSDPEARWQTGASW